MNWKIIEKFTGNVNRLREIFYDPSKKSTLKFEEISKEAETDELFAFVLHLLIEETRCRYDGPVVLELESSLNEQFCTIESWFKQVISGLVSEPFPTVEYLLKKQHKLSIYSEFDDIFAATKFLNSLASIYDPNAKIIDASPILNVEQYEIYRKLPKAIRNLVDSVFHVHVPKDSEGDFSKGPSFRYEIMNYIDFDGRSDFKSIPIQLLENDEGTDVGSPFGKRWARRLIAKTSAYDKINFDALKIGRFPKPLPKSLESTTINFHVQLPESVGIDLLHQNAFDNSFLSQDFLDFSSFSVHFAKFLEEIPAILSHNLKNTDIFEHAPLMNPSRTGSKASLASFRALLLATGIRGHLTCDILPPVDIHEILNFDSEGTSASLLLALALSTLKNPLKTDQSRLLNKLFTMHLPSFQSSLGMEIPPILQLAATLSLGIFKFRSFDRGSSQLLLKEIFKSLPLNVNFKPIEDSPLLSIVPALTLGMCLMGSASSIDPNHRQFAQDIQNQLSSNLSSCGNKTQHQISVLIASCLINIGNAHFPASNLPWSRSLPDLLDKPEPIVFWCQLNLLLAQWSSDSNDDFSNLQGLDKVKLNFEAIFESVCNPSEDSVWTDSSELALFSYACQCITAKSVYLSLKLSGTCKSIDSLDFWITKLLSFPILRNSDPDFFLVKIQTNLLTTLQYLIMTKCLIFSGTGDSECWALLRSFMSDPLIFKFGNGKLFYSSIGFLFLGKGRLRISTQAQAHESNGEIDHLAVVSLLCSIFPMLPASPVDSEFSFLTLLDSIWPLSIKTN